MYLMRGLLRHWTKSSIIPRTKGESVWRNKRPIKKTASFAAGQIAYLIYEYFRVTGSHDSVENYADLFTIALFEMTIFKNSTQSGTEFYCLWRKSHLMISWRIVQIKNTRVWDSQDRIGIVRPGDSSEEVRTWLSQNESYGEEKYRARFTK